MTTTIDFDLGMLKAEADSLLTTPLLQQFTAAASSGSDVDCSFNWNCQDPSHNDWKDFMSYVSSQDDLNDTEAEDITYYTYKTEWYGGDYMSDTTTLITGQLGELPYSSGTYTPTTIGDELTLHIGKNIFGDVGGLDMLSNEVDFTANVKSESKAKLDVAIEELLDSSNGNGSGNTARTTTNFAYQILSRIVDVSGGAVDRRNAAIQAFIARATPTTEVKMPFIAGDTITFTIKVQPKFNQDTTGNEADNHGIGTNTVQPRKYKITLHLTDTTPA